MERYPIGSKARGFHGETFHTTPNPPFGAVFTYYLHAGLESRKKARGEAEKKVAEQGGDVFYPSWEELRAEDRAEDPAMVLTVSDQEGNVVRRLIGPADKGFHRVAWNLRLPSAEPTSLEAPSEDPEDTPPSGPMVLPGTYRVQLAQRVDGVLTAVGEPQTFSVRPLANATLPAPDRSALVAFQRRTAELQRAVLGASRAAGEAETRLAHLEQAVIDAPRAEAALRQEVVALEHRLADLLVELEGDPTIARRNEPVPPAIADRVDQVVNGSWASTSETTATHRRNYEIAAEQFAAFLPRLRQLLADLAALERRAEASGAPWTPGRVPEWEP
jgi:hypothetical protein